MTPEGLVARYGSKYAARGIMLTCPVCRRPLAPYGLHSTTVPSRFDHPDGVRDCALSAANDTRYRHLQPGGEGDGEQARSAFLEDQNLKRAYAFCQRMCKHLVTVKFKELIGIADGLGVWSYARLELWIIPFILLTLNDFQGNRFNFRFFLRKPRNKPYNDLWLSPEECCLEKVFADSGTPIKALPDIPNPFPITRELYDLHSANADWIDDKLLTMLRP